jgi:hypothetical protein
VTETSFITPSSEFVKTTLCVPGVTCTWTLGVLPIGFPSSKTSEAGSELMLRKPSPPDGSGGAPDAEGAAEGTEGGGVGAGDGATATAAGVATERGREGLGAGEVSTTAGGAGGAVADATAAGAGPGAGATGGGATGRGVAEGGGADTGGGEAVTAVASGEATRSAGASANHTNAARHTLTSAIAAPTYRTIVSRCSGRDPNPRRLAMSSSSLGPSGRCSRIPGLSSATGTLFFRARAFSVPGFASRAGSVVFTEGGRCDREPGATDFRAAGLVDALGLRVRPFDAASSLTGRPYLPFRLAAVVSVGPPFKPCMRISRTRLTGDLS